MLYDREEQLDWERYQSALSDYITQKDDGPATRGPFPFLLHHAELLQLRWKVLKAFQKWKQHGW